MYGDHENGSAGKKKIVADGTYRDEGNYMCGNSRFIKCLMAWYGKTRRMTKKQLDSLRIEDMEFSRKEIAMVDMTASLGPLDTVRGVRVCSIGLAYMG
jgi:hypothetical protein